MGQGRAGEDGVGRVDVSIAGEVFQLKSDVPADRIHALARDIDARFRRVLAAYPYLARHRAALLVALELAEALDRAEQENKELLALLQEVRGP